MKKLFKTMALCLVVALLGVSVFAGCNPQSSENPSSESQGSTMITLDQDSITLDADRTQQLVVSGASEVDWASSNPQVATVDANGNVTGVNPGTCTVTATTKDGNFQAECMVAVTGYHLSQSVFSGFTKVENNPYNGEINYAVDNSNESVFAVSYDRLAMSNAWTSLILWYDTALNPTAFELEFEVVKGSVPCVMFEFGGEASFKHYERVAVAEGKNTYSLNVTDLDLNGEGSWKAIYLELNNPCPLTGTTDEVKELTQINFTSIKLIESEKKAPSAPTNPRVEEGIVYWDRVLSAVEYEIEVDGVMLTDVSARTRHAGDAPVMQRAYRPTEENAFTAGTHNAKIRSKNSVGVSDWTEFSFTIPGGEVEEPEVESFRQITGHENNYWNATANFYTATTMQDGSVKIAFQGASSDMWSTYLFNFNVASVNAEKLHIKVKRLSGNLEKIRYQMDGGTGTVYGDDIIFDENGVGELTANVTNEGLASTYGSVMLFLNKYATEGEAIEIQVLDVSLYTEGQTEAPEVESFRGIIGHENNYWNASANFYTATTNEDKSVNIGFTAAASDEWSTYLFKFETATIDATKLHIKVRLVSGNLEKIRFQMDGGAGTVYGDDLSFDADGYAELTIDVTNEGLANTYGSVMLFLNKYATEGEVIEIQVLDVSLYKA